MPPLAPPPVPPAPAPPVGRLGFAQPLRNLAPDHPKVSPEEGFHFHAALRMACDAGFKAQSQNFDVSGPQGTVALRQAALRVSRISGARRIGLPRLWFRPASMVYLYIWPKTTLRAFPGLPPLMPHDPLRHALRHWAPSHCTFDSYRNTSETRAMAVWRWTNLNPRHLDLRELDPPRQHPQSLWMVVNSVQRHHFEAMVETILVFTGESYLQGFLSGAGFGPSAKSKLPPILGILANDLLPTHMWAKK